MYTETLSPTFTGMTFSQASELCFVKLKLLLLAIEVKTDDGNDNKISINPRGTKLPSSTVGFFIAQSAEEVKRYLSLFELWKMNKYHHRNGNDVCICIRAWFYCKACHEGIKDETQIKKCKCKNCKLANPSASIKIKAYQRTFT